jgi:hypothetical protein
MVKKSEKRQIDEKMSQIDARDNEQHNITKPPTVVMPDISK